MAVFQGQSFDVHARERRGSEQNNLAARQDLRPVVKGFTGCQFRELREDAAARWNLD
jgi:hypothetical protein